uniref:Uncharacterized protein n=1 Tax=Amblyomma maculatum TaxID=34609 RepID=G3MSK5_AMBMU
MRRQVAICFLAAICFSGVVASSEQHDGKLLNKQCKRAIPLMPWRANYRLSCTYLCQGWPFRFGNEPDGIPCGPVQPLIRTTNVCAGGLCVPAYIAERTFNLRNKTITNLRTSEGTTEEPTKKLLHSTTNFPKTSGVTRRKHYTPSERTQGTTGDAAVEMSTTSLRSASTENSAVTTTSAIETTFETRTDRASEDFGSSVVTSTTSSETAAELPTEMHIRSEQPTTSVLPEITDSATHTEHPFVTDDGDDFWQPIA